MSFRIGLLEDTTLETIYGYYPRRTDELVTVLKSYKKPSDIKKILEQGDVYHLKKTVKDSLFYCRDKGDPINGCNSYIENIKDLKDITNNVSPVDFYFIYTNKWNIYDVNKEEWLTLNKLSKYE